MKSYSYFKRSESLLLKAAARLRVVWLKCQDMTYEALKIEAFHFWRGSGNLGTPSTYNFQTSLPAKQQEATTSFIGHSLLTGTMVSDHVYKLCQEVPSVSSEFAKNPQEAPIDIIKRLYGHHKPNTSHEVSGNERPVATPADLERARQCGKWGASQPSEFFLQIYHDVLQTFDADVLGGMVSPPLMGSYGTVPLTVIAPLADIIRHMSNLIVRAEKEVFLITCSWSPSVAQILISDALKELSVRAGKRGQRVVVKVMYDKAGAANFINNRQVVKPEAYSG